ncbi:ATP-binding protein [Acinetobacter sp. HY1485]|uniref:ATP-binding protein n=1 Tax=Acinetobacter sp. HY1485 TaxID=2970918 RepID=UPI0022B96B82|nr:ATP-binding protein [Acinetobacter sp. HY1485]
MSAMPKFKIELEPTNQVCSKHNEPMLMMFGRPFCKSCSNEALQNSKFSTADFEHMRDQKRFDNAMLPKRHTHCTFENYMTQHSGQKYAKQQFVSFYQDYLKDLKRNGVIVGRTGTGKTHLACALARNLLSKKQNIRYITSEDMSNEIAKAWTDKSMNESTLIAQFVACDLLILDEYGLHDQHETRLQLVHKVLYARYDACKPTMLISNFTKDQLKENLGDRLWSRFQQDKLTMIECDWEDMRSGVVV